MTISTPENEKQIAFSREHGGCRKDVERAFGVLQARWAFVRHSARIWSLNTVVEDERERANKLQGWEFQGPLITLERVPQLHKNLTFTYKRTAIFNTERLMINYN
jgi:hypothetical protein